MEHVTAVPRVLWGLVSGGSLDEFGLKWLGNCSAGEYGDWRAGGALRGDVCGVRADKDSGLARARALPVERLRERLVRVRSWIQR